VARVGLHDRAVDGGLAVGGQEALDERDRRSRAARSSSRASSSSVSCTSVGVRAMAIS
jgi:hypothetical protein